MEYKRKIPRASLQQISDFHLSFMSYRLANVPVCLGKELRFMTYFENYHESPFVNWELFLSTWPQHRTVKIKAYHCSFPTFVVSGAIFGNIWNCAITIAMYITVYLSL